MKEVFFYFLRLGVLGFGGPLALVAQMQKDLVIDKKWIDDDNFRRTFGLIKAMPGPVAFQTAVFLSHHRAGFRGACLGAIGMILPSFILMVLLAAFYGQLTEIPILRSLMMGMQLGAFAVIIGALKSLSQNFLQEFLFWVLLVCGIILSFFSILPEPILILLLGTTAVAAFQMGHKKLALDPVIFTLGLVCLKAGAFVFGTGLAIVPFLENDFVTRLQWLSHSQFMDALAFGQLTPGPVVITVSFVGYKVAGMWGAVVATVAVFLPSFIHMVTWFPRALNWLHKQKWVRSFTMGVIAAVCSAILISLLHISRDWNFIQYIGVVLMMALLLFKKIPSWALVLFGGVYGIMAHWIWPL